MITAIVNVITKKNREKEASILYPVKKPYLYLFTLWGCEYQNPSISQSDVDQKKGAKQYNTGSYFLLSTVPYFLWSKYQKKLKKIPE